jgi:hypothetical protein
MVVGFGLPTPESESLFERVDSRLFATPMSKYNSRTSDHNSYIVHVIGKKGD